MNSILLFTIKPDFEKWLVCECCKNLNSYCRCFGNMSNFQERPLHSLTLMSVYELE